MGFDIYNSRRQQIICCILVAILCCWFGKTAWAQNAMVKVGEFNCSEYDRIETKVFFIEHLQEKGYTVEAGSTENVLDIYAPATMLGDHNEVINLVHDEAFAFSFSSKEEKTMYFADHFHHIPTNVYEKLTMPKGSGGRDDNDNTTCDAALPFCTDNGLYTFYPNYDAGYLCSSCGPPYDDCEGLAFEHNGSTYDGIASAPDPAFYYLQIGQGGNLDIHIVGTTASGDFTTSYRLP